MGERGGNWFSSARTWLLLRMYEPVLSLTRAPNVPAMVNWLVGSWNPTEQPGCAGRISVRGFSVAAFVTRCFAGAAKGRKRPVSSTSTGKPLMDFGRRCLLSSCPSGYFSRTKNLTAQTPVCLPLLIFSPPPTPITFSVGTGLMARTSARAAVIGAASFLGGGNNRFDHSDFAAV